VVELGGLGRCKVTSIDFGLDMDMEFPANSQVKEKLSRCTGHLGSGRDGSDSSLHVLKWRYLARNDFAHACIWICTKRV